MKKGVHAHCAKEVPMERVKHAVCAVVGAALVALFAYLAAQKLKKHDGGDYAVGDVIAHYFSDD